MMGLDEAIMTAQTPDPNSKATDSTDSKWKYLVVVDDTPESAKALRYGAQRALHTGGGLTLLFVVPPGEFQHWVNVGDILREDAFKDAAQTVSDLASDVRRQFNVVPEIVLREGKPKAEVMALIEEDPNIHVLILAAGTGMKGPGPLVTAFTGKAAAKLPLPLVIVPGNLADEAIDRLS